MKKRIVVLTGAGMSAESGISTFRDAGGLWEGYDVMAVASPDGWRKDPDLVRDFYNQRRRQLFEVAPNAGHQALVDLEADYDVRIITQNVDDLHERAGSRNVLHLHGELRKVRSTGQSSDIYAWDGDLRSEDRCPQGYPLRPHIVWFGEEVPALSEAIYLVDQADLVMIIGTSLQVYPAAGLLHYVPPGSPIIYIDPNPAPVDHFGKDKIDVIAQTAATGVPLFVNSLLQKK
ncbi:MAG: NAD-dependent deacylase [Saprospiraceae bacterium]|nr:NAD-dependent deacylase [Saprospiraceae bacterium]